MKKIEEGKGAKTGWTRRKLKKNKQGNDQKESCEKNMKSK